MTTFTPGFAISLPEPEIRVHAWWVSNAQSLAKSWNDIDPLNHPVIRAEFVETFPKRAERGNLVPPDFIAASTAVMGRDWIEAMLSGYEDPLAESSETISDRAGSHLYNLARMVDCRGGSLGHVVENRHARAPRA